MRYTASEKAEIIQLVEQSHLPAKRTLDKLGIPRATFYRWYDRYRTGGPSAHIEITITQNHIVAPICPTQCLRRRPRWQWPSVAETHVARFAIDTVPKAALSSGDQTRSVDTSRTLGDAALNRNISPVGGGSKI
jgi:hypothetical protein